MKILDEADTSSLSDKISETSKSPLKLIAKMTSCTDRIALKSVKKMLDELNENSKMKLPDEFVQSIDSIIKRNLTRSTTEYIDELCYLT